MTDVATPVPPTSNPMSASLRRRSFLAGTAAVAAVPALAGLAGPADAASLKFATQGRRAQNLANMMGVVTVTSTKQGVYGERSLVKSRLLELGARHLRNRVFTGNKGQIDFLRELGAAGFRLNALMGDPTNTAGTPEQLVQLVGEHLSHMTSSLEGANEWNLEGGANWVNELRGHQSRLWKAAKANPRTRGIPVLAPALGMRDGFQQLGSLEAYCDYGNMHLYTGGFIPGYRSDDMLAMQRYVSGAKPVMVTETGWHNAMKTGATHHPTPEGTAAVYGPRLFLEYFVRGVPRVFLFQLLDDASNPGLTDHEAHFGLLRHDFSRKPLFTALSNFMSLLDKPGAPSVAAPAPLAFTVNNAPSDFMKVLVRRNDGAYVLFLWRRCSIYDSPDRVALKVANAPVSVTFGSRRSVQTFRPTSSRSAVASATGTLGVDVSLGADVVALVIK